MTTFSPQYDRIIENLPISKHKEYLLSLLAINTLNFTSTVNSEEILQSSKLLKKETA